MKTRFLDVIWHLSRINYSPRRFEWLQKSERCFFFLFVGQLIYNIMYENRQNYTYYYYYYYLFEYINIINWWYYTILCFYYFYIILCRRQTSPTRRGKSVNVLEILHASTYYSIIRIVIIQNVFITILSRLAETGRTRFGWNYQMIARVRSGLWVGDVRLGPTRSVLCEWGAVKKRKHGSCIQCNRNLIRYRRCIQFYNDIRIDI